jgi:hypothetical protein
MEQVTDEYEATKRIMMRQLRFISMTKVISPPMHDAHANELESDLLIDFLGSGKRTEFNFWVMLTECKRH